MSIRLNGGFLTVDLTATFQVPLATVPLSGGMWFKKIGNWVDFDPIISIAPALNNRGSSIELFNNQVAGATGQFQAATGGSSLGLAGGLAFPITTWLYVGWSLDIFGGGVNLTFYAGDTSSLTSYAGNTLNTTANYRYITIGDLAQQGLVTKFNGEVAQPRIWGATRSAAQMLVEAQSNVPVDTADLVYSSKMASTSDNTDLSGHGITWASSGTVVDGASDPPNSGGGGGGGFPPVPHKEPAGMSMAAILSMRGRPRPPMQCSAEFERAERLIVPRRTIFLPPYLENQQHASRHPK